MRELLHHVEAGIVLMFAMTLVSLATVLYYLGPGLWSVWALSMIVVYFVGKSAGSLAERRVFESHLRNNHDR